MDISDIDLPNYGILKISLDKKDVDNLYTIIKKYSPSHFQWEGNTLIKSTTDQQQFGLSSQIIYSFQQIEKRN